MLLRSCSVKSVALRTALSEFSADVVKGGTSAMGFSFDDVVLTSMAGLKCKTIGDVVQLLAPELLRDLPAKLHNTQFKLNSAAPVDIHGSFSDKGKDHHEVQFGASRKFGVIGKPCTLMGPDGVCRLSQSAWCTVAVKLYTERVPTKVAKSNLFRSDIRNAFQRSVSSDLCTPCP